MADVRQILDQLKQELDAFKSSGAAGAFRVSAQTADALGKLVRGLEEKRQVGELTEAEANVLRSIDAAKEKIAQYNRVRAGRRESGYSLGVGAKPLYDLRTGKLSEEPEDHLPAFVPKISQDQADQIISDINEQFESKVLKKIRRYPDLEKPADPSLADFRANPNHDQQGRNLQDYLTAVRAERPNVPFLDEDSHADLSRIAKKHARPE